MILQDLVEDLTQALTVFFAKILETSCQELIKNFAKSSEDLVGTYIQDLGKILIRSCKNLSKFLLKFDLARSCTISYTKS